MIRHFLRGVGNALSGLSHAIKTEQNLQIDAAIALCVIGGGCLFALSSMEWIATTLCMGLVISAECMNTALERLARPGLARTASAHQAG